MSDDRGGDWECEFCESKGLNVSRNCEGQGFQGFIVTLYGREFRQCPKNYLNSEEAELVGTVYLCEGGFGSSMLPSMLLNETAYYWSVRNIIMIERNRIQKIKEAKERGKDGRR